MLDEKMDKMRQKRKIRISSWIFAIVYLIYGICLFVIIPKFGDIYQKIEVPLPQLMSLVFSIPSLVWIVLAFILAILLIMRDISGKTALFPNWVALLMLLISAFILIIVLLMPIFGPIYT